MPLHGFSSYPTGGARRPPGAAEDLRERRSDRSARPGCTQGGARRQQVLDRVRSRLDKGDGRARGFQLEQRVILEFHQCISRKRFAGREGNPRTLHALGRRSIDIVHRGPLRSCLGARHGGAEHEERQDQGHVRDGGQQAWRNGENAS